MKTYAEARAAIPADAVWSSVFGWPGECPFSEFWRTPDGKRYRIDNGRNEWAMNWTVTEV